MIYYSEGKNLVKIWGNEVEDTSMEQIKNLSNLPFVFKHISIMPDNHAGFGCPIGTVLATKDVIIPSIAGSDLGCGCCAVKTSLTEIDNETLKKIMGEIRKVIPVGFNKHKEKCESKIMPGYDFRDFKSIVAKEFENARKSLGSLGSGNHFLSIEKGSDGHIWIMIHSGSRNLGKKVADHYNNIAKELNAKWHSSVPKEYDLAFLPIDSDEGQAYLREMQYCVDFALANRKLMMNEIRAIFYKNTNVKEFIDFIDIKHNYISQENHFVENVFVHRKGATLAREDTIGIIPGSCGSSSYIVQGLGNKDSYCSSPHGAGRVMSRKKAIENLSFEDELNILNDQGIIHELRHKDDLQEATGSYKNINEVMENSKDLVKILVKLNPLCVIKG